MSAISLEKAIAELAKRETEYGKALYDYAIAEHDYRLKKNQEHELAVGSDKLRTTLAEIACEKEMLVKLKAEAHKEFMKTKCDDARTVISARKEMMIIDARMTGQV